MRVRKPLFVVQTSGMEGLSVTLYEDTWTNHIAVRHPEVSGLLNEVKATVMEPDLVLESATQPGAYLFVSTEVKDETGRFLRVPVLPVPPGSQQAIVTTCYFSSNITTAGAVIYPATSIKPGEKS